MMVRPRKSAEAVIKDIKRQTIRKFSSEEMIRIVLEGLKGEESISEICRRESIERLCTKDICIHCFRNACIELFKMSKRVVLIDGARTPFSRSGTDYMDVIEFHEAFAGLFQPLYATFRLPFGKHSKSNARMRINSSRSFTTQICHCNQQDSYSLM
jgi:hypothetical protein